MSPEERQRLLRLPKAELHLHLEGSLTPETLWRLSQRQGAPHRLTTLDKCRDLYRFHDFAGFIQAIKTASLHLATPADYADAVTALAHALQAQNVVYAEVFVSIGILLWRHAAVEPYWEAIESARQAAEVATGVRLAWLFDAVRQFGPEPLEQVVTWAIKLQTSGSVVGIGVGGDEATVPAAALAPAYARARAAGLHTTIHAGETRGPEAVWDVVRHLQPERIGHGLHAFQDPALMDALAERGISLDICPTSNLSTGAWRFGPAPNGRYPALEYYNRGIKIAVSTDDPGIFGCSLLDEYAFLRERGGFGADELERVIAGAWACSFLPPDERRG